MTSETLIDRFERDIPSGRAIGSLTAEGAVRRGVDRENVIGVDNGALRIQPLVKPGWGRSGIAYGPYDRQAGLAFHVLILNGHNVSRSEPLPDGFRGRLLQWLAGPENEPRRRRLLGWLRSGQKRHMWRRLRQWLQSGAGRLYWPWIEENLAVGWFPLEVPTQPLRQGCSLAVHALVAEGGELWASVGGEPAPTVRGLQNVPVYYTVVLRERGAAYYVSSPVDVPAFGTFPKLRPVAIDAFNDDRVLYAGIHQSVLGEIGFRVDTRVYGTQIVKSTELSGWYGSAHGADLLSGTGSLDKSAAQIGGPWSVCCGRLIRTDRGVTGKDADNMGLLALPAPTGLLHTLIERGEGSFGTVSVIWRAVDQQNFWSFEVSNKFARLVIVEGGRWNRHACVAGRYLPPRTVSSLQVYDDGERIRVYLNGALVYGTTVHDTRLGTATGVGLSTSGSNSDVVIRSFEAHPREVMVPAVSNFHGPSFKEGTQVIATDNFDGLPGDLAGQTTTTGGFCWKRQIGSGIIQCTGKNSARVVASAQQPCPGRTAYLIPWPNRNFADLQVTITPPSKRQGTQEKGRAGLIFWQDPDNYLIVSAWIEARPCMSISAFFRIAGFEELYDAVWTNVGSRLDWGQPYEFRVAFDGREFTAYVDGEPVLYRALTDVYPHCEGFRIDGVGIVANWEWGNDTGSTFEKFVGRIRS